MIEAELKARVHAPEAVMRQLDERATARFEVYKDTYYDRPDKTLQKADQELRLRTVHGADATRTVLTFKDAVVEEASGSKPEHETEVANAAAVHAMLLGLGYRPVIAFEKRCRNYDVEAVGRRMLATLVRVPEIDGTFLELETLVDEADVVEALDDLRSVLAELGIGPEDLTRELYTEAVAARRGTRR
ncbi:class IV adenylate cyclase [Streptomyces griseocarneus]|uniref:class IV adenylate cyclase n=1 Tax=Streptomyces griseocarneus TaxID=51201 RepID=UPI00167CD3E0|nr:class IV adenylate cyclase [Streptomyces griseocarneus]MBZ6472330.1 class IV adenylate cyclase [Streptomyces griseocarneus]GHG72582.1 adenylate cyclase [Streptomyces griseocarneus]